MILFSAPPVFFFVTNVPKNFSTIDEAEPSYTVAFLINNMAKRKRNGEPNLQDILDKHQDDVSRALKASKGFERQRLSKRLRDQGNTQDKIQRLEREIAVLKVSMQRGYADEKPLDYH